jgi:hypothetical protein
MKAGQFVRGKIDGIQKNFESPGLEKLLPTDKLSELADNVEVGEYPRFFKQEKVIAKTVIAPAENSDGRRGGIVNHTVLYKYDSTVSHDGVKYLFDTETFIAEILAGKRRFKMPPVPKLPEGVDSGFIDLPPPIEWEVES